MESENKISLNVLDHNLLCNQIKESESYKHLCTEEKFLKARTLRITDYETAILLLKDLAIAENSEEAQIYLGMHRALNGRKAHFEEAVKWFLMAAENNKSGEGYRWLGRMYGSIGEFETAKMYLDIAIGMGYGPALSYLKELEKDYSSD